MGQKTKILICGILPPPYFGHSMIYKILMDSDFVRAYDVIFFNMKFWTYGQHKKVTILKILKMVKYYFEYIGLILFRRPAFVLYSISFDKMPFLKDVLFCATGRMLGCRVVLHDMGQYVKELSDSSSSSMQALIRWLLRRITASILLGETTKEVYRGFMEPARLLSVPGSVADSAQMVLPMDNARKPDPQRVRVLYFSFLSVSKGVWTALKAIPKVIKDDPRVHFVFAGPVESEALHQEILRFVKDQKLESNFEYIGYVGDDAKRTECFRSSDIFIFPTHRDVFGLVILHAMAEGLPVIASREGTIPEIIRDGESGFLFPKENAGELAGKILLLAKDEQLRRKMGAAGRQRYLQNFTPPMYGKKMIDAFKVIEGLQRA